MQNLPQQTGQVILPAVRDAWKNGWPAFVILPLNVWALYRVATWRPDLEPTDSAEFGAAMDNVLPLVLSRARTPRSVKRFVNKVRYLAMRMRQRESDDRSVWARLWDKRPIAPAAASSISDSALVVLAALDYWKPSSLDTDEGLGAAVAAWPSLNGYDQLALVASRRDYLKFSSGLNVN